MLTSRNNDLRWILATIVKSGNHRFWGWHELCFVTFFCPLFLLRTWNQNFFFRFRAGNSPVQPLLLPEPMVKMWPSSSLQAPTSDAFLGTVALAPLPRPPWPRPPRPLFPPRPAFVSRPMSSGILGFSFRGILRSSFHYVTESVTHEVTR